MKFELKTLSLAAAAKTKTDTLIVLISDRFKAAQDPISTLIAKATQAKDFSSKAGQSLQAYAIDGIAASKVILLGVGEGLPADIKSAVTKATAALKSAQSSQTLAVFSESVNAAQLKVAVLTFADSTYVYSTRK